MPPNVIEIRQANRWAAFTTPELHNLDSVLAFAKQYSDLPELHAEIRAELARRKDRTERW